MNSPLLRLPPELRKKVFCLVEGLGMDEDNTGYYNKTWDRLNLSRSCRQIWAETAERYFSAAIRDLRCLKVTINDMFDIPSSLPGMQQWEMNLIRSVETTYDHWVDQFRSISMPCSWHRLPALTGVCVVLSNHSTMWWDDFDRWFRRWTKKPDLLISLTDGTWVQTYAGPNTFNR
jgi:hypothetical protein